MSLDPSILKAIGAAIVLFVAPFSATVIGIAAAAALIVHNWDWIKEHTQGLVNFFVEAWPQVKDAVMSAVDWIVNTGAAGALQKAWDGILAGVKATSSVGDFIVEWWPKVTDRRQGGAPSTGS